MSSENRLRRKTKHLCCRLAAEGLEERYLLSYTITDVRTFPGYTFSTATGVNASGQAVGYDFTSNLSSARAYLYDSGALTDLGSLGGDHAYAEGINDLGQVAGFSQLPGDTVSHAFRYDAGTLTDLAPFGGNSYAYAINQNGDVAGYAAANGGDHAVLWQGTSMTDLGTLGGSTSYGQAINDRGIVVGLSYLPGDAVFHAFIAWRGRMADLGTLPGAANSWAYGVNNLGQVVGFSGNNLNDYHAFLWDRVNGMQDLGTLGGVRSYANAINDAGQVVGYSALPNGIQDAFLEDGGVLTDLNDLLPPDSGWNVYQAAGINNAGQIVGEGFHDGAQHGYVLTPGPGPASVPLFQPASLISAPASAGTLMVVGAPDGTLDQLDGREPSPLLVSIQLRPTPLVQTTPAAPAASVVPLAHEPGGGLEGAGDSTGNAAALDAPDQLVSLKDPRAG